MDRRTIFTNHIEKILEETLDSFAELNLNLKSKSARNLIASEIMKKLEVCGSIAKDDVSTDKDDFQSKLQPKELDYIRKSLGKR